MKCRGAACRVCGCNRRTRHGPFMRNVRSKLGRPESPRFETATRNELTPIARARFSRERSSGACVEPVRPCDDLSSSSPPLLSPRVSAIRQRRMHRVSPIELATTSPSTSSTSSSLRVAALRHDGIVRFLLFFLSCRIGPEVKETP